MTIITTPAQHLAAIKSALELCPKPADRTLPAELDWADEIAARLRALAYTPPSVNQIIDTDPANLDEALNEYAAAVNRQHGAEAAIKAGVVKALQARHSEHLRDLVPEVLGRLAPVFTKMVTQLRTAARDLPAGPAATDPRAILDAGAGSAHQSAQEALHAIRLIGKVHRTPPTHRGGAALAAVAAVPESVGPTLIDPLRHAPADPAQAATNRAIRDAVEAYATNPDLALMDLAREQHQPLRLDLALDAATLHQRLEAIDAAHRTEALRDTTTAGVAAARA